tara:strand:- start:1281 stop:1844 length:564 start_codon:yes stop_codon:yes gene_type:complete
MSDSNSNSNFGFMKSGITTNASVQDDAYMEEYIEYAQLLIGLFMSKAIKIAARYCVLAQRNTLTKEDIEYALKYQAIEFFETTNVTKEIGEYKSMILSLMYECDDEVEEDNMNNENDDLDNDDEVDEVDEVDEAEEPFTKADPKLIKDYNDCHFVKKMNHYYNYWQVWKPTNYFEKSIKNAINHIEN